MGTKNHGGARPGSGRKKSTKATSFHLDIDLIDRVNDIKNKSRFFNAAIREKLDRIDAVIKDVEELE
jgi:hypothetical protein